MRILSQGGLGWIHFSLFLSMKLITWLKVLGILQCGERGFRDFMRQIRVLGSSILKEVLKEPSILS